MEHKFGSGTLYLYYPAVTNGSLVLTLSTATNADLEVQAKKMNVMGIAHSPEPAGVCFNAGLLRTWMLFRNEKDETPDA